MLLVNVAFDVFVLFVVDGWANVVDRLFNVAMFGKLVADVVFVVDVGGKIKLKSMKF